MATASTEDQDYTYEGLCSARKAAEYLGISVKTVWKKCATGELPHTRLPNSRHLLIPVAALRAFEKRALREGDCGDQ